MHFDMEVKGAYKPRVLSSATSGILIEHFDGDDLSLEYPPGTVLGVIKKGDVLLASGNLFLASSATGCRVRIHVL